MFALVIAVLVFGGVQQPTGADGSGSPAAIASATKFELAFSSGRVSGCTVTATSGNPKVDQYVCDSARFCGGRYSDADRRAACMADKRSELVDRIVKNPKWLNW